MRILGLDPGSRHTGWGVLEEQGGRLAVAGHGRLSPPAASPLPGRLAFLLQGLDELVARFTPDVAVLETPFRGLNVRSLIVLSEARGALLAGLGRSGVEIREYSPAEVKAAVVGNGRADKEQVARLVGLELRLAGALPADTTDALAVALCYARRVRFERLGAAKALC